MQGYVNQIRMSHRAAAGFFRARRVENTGKEAKYGEKTDFCGAAGAGGDSGLSGTAGQGGLYGYHGPLGGDGHHQVERGVQHHRRL